MTPAEATKVADWIAGAWTPHGTSWRKVWEAELLRRDFDAARIAVRALADEHPDFPSLGRVLHAIRAQERAGRGFPPDNATPASPDTVQRCLAEARAALGAAMNHATEGEQP